MDDDIGFYDNIQDYSDGSVPLQKHQDLLKNLTNFNPYLRETINDWLGLKWDEEAKTFTRDPFIKPTMNVQGAVWCINHMKTYARENNIITDISKEHYNYMMGDILDELWLNLVARKEEFGIKHNGDIMKIANKLEHTAALVLMGAGDGRYNKMLATTYHHTSSDVNQQNSGMPNTLPPSPPRKNMLQRLKKVMFGA